MISKAKLLSAMVAAFVLGAVFPVLLIWNPANWEWASRLTGKAQVPPADVARNSEGEKQLWTCGMHPQVLQEEPGNCPICGMRLVPVKDSPADSSPNTFQEARSAGDAENEREILYWRAPMDPNYTSDKPGKSPMGMDLVPVYADEAGAGGPSVRVDPNFLQNFAVRTAVVERGSIPIEIQTVGTLAHDEKNLVSVNAKFGGWIEKAYVNNVGEHVHRGDLLFEIYSPPLVTTQKEYLAAKRYLEKIEASGYPEVIERARSLLEAARERLHFWDITPDQIEELERSGTVARTMEIFSPATGHVIAKSQDFLEGLKVTPGMHILTLGDHTVLWVEAEFFESQVGFLREGQPVTVEVDAFPGRRWTGRISHFNPFVDPETRTLKAFVEVPNPNLTLRPKMFARVSARPPAVAQAVKVPQQAILHSGERAVVIVEKSRGVFEPREVELGPAGGDYQEVRSGVEAGEVIVTSSQFLIDSESNLKAAIRQLLGDRSRRGTAESREPKPSPVEHVH